MIKYYKDFVDDKLKVPEKRSRRSTRRKKHATGTDADDIESIMSNNHESPCSRRDMMGTEYSGDDRSLYDEKSQTKSSFHPNAIKEKPSQNSIMN